MADNIISEVAVLKEKNATLATKLTNLEKTVSNYIDTQNTIHNNQKIVVAVITILNILVLATVIAFLFVI